MNHPLTDDAVAALPLHHGRAELLEEIMRTPVLDDRPVDTPREHPRRGWLVPAAAAAAVAVLAAGSAWWASSTGPDDVSAPQVAAVVPADAYRAVLDDEGWTVEDVYDDVEQGTGDIGYSMGGASVQIDWYPASGYDARYDDRRHLTDPPSDDTPVDLLGLGSSMWAYSDQDHTVIRPVENGHFLEVRGSGLTEQQYVDLLGRLRLVDLEEFEAALPDEFATSTERDARVSAILDGIEAQAGTLLPDGVARSSITSEQSDPYHLGADVTGQVACAWVGQFAQAQRTGDESAAEQAAGVMETSYRWPVLKQMDARGDWSEWIWSMADDLDAGRVPPGWQQSCAG